MTTIRADGYQAIDVEIPGPRRLLPILLFAILRLSNDAAIMGEYRNGRIVRAVAATVAIIVSTLSILLIGKTIADMF